MPFGLKNSATTFQRFMDKIFFNVHWIFVNLDDILVCIDNKKLYQEDLNKVFSILNENNLNISLAKCIFNVSKHDFQGFSVCAEDLLHINNRNQKPNSFSYPKDSKNLHKILSSLGFFCKLIPKKPVCYLLSERM